MKWFSRIRLLRTTGFALLIGGALALGASLKIALSPDTYTSMVRFVCEKSPNVPPAANFYADFNCDFSLTASEMITSKELLTKVMERLELRKRWAKTYSNQEILSVKFTYHLLETQIKLRYNQKSQLVSLWFTGTSPIEAAEIANQIAEEFVAWQKENKRQRQSKYIDAKEALLDPLMINDPVVPIVDKAEPSLRPNGSRRNWLFALLITSACSLCCGFEILHCARTLTEGTKTTAL